MVGERWGFLNKGSGCKGRNSGSFLASDESSDSDFLLFSDEALDTGLLPPLPLLEKEDPLEVGKVEVFLLLEVEGLPSTVT